MILASAEILGGHWRVLKTGIFSSQLRNQILVYQLAFQHFRSLLYGLKSLLRTIRKALCGFFLYI
jgi:hypothetical protein